jgi:GH25 family lysozyme M1 (1,4-beta-N-acetylmuramidase)
MFPLKQRKIGGYKFSERTWYSSRHLGSDYSAAKGTPLYAPFDGEIIKRFWGVEGGNTIWFKPSGQNVIIRLLHLSAFNARGKVKSGQIIGYTGNSGSLTKVAHLHLDISKGSVNIWDFNNFVDPETFDWKENPQPSQEELYGIDISHYQKINWDKVKTDFVIAKCTESTNYKDPTYQTNRDKCREKGILFGSYHFARGGDANKEAEWFMHNVGVIEKGELLVLDWEISHPATVKWCLQWLREVESLAGFKPLIYLNSSTAKSLDWTSVIKNNTGLWIANYSVNDGTRHDNPSIGKWPFFAIHQYTSKGKVAGIVGNVDLDYCKMNLETFKKYGKQ